MNVILSRAEDAKPRARNRPHQSQPTSRSWTDHARYSDDDRRQPVFFLLRENDRFAQEFRCAIVRVRLRLCVLVNRWTLYRPVNTRSANVNKALDPSLDGGARHIVRAVRIDRVVFLLGCPRLRRYRRHMIDQLTVPDRSLDSRGVGNVALGHLDPQALKQPNVTRRARQWPYLIPRIH